jgi:hypothetical protein
LTHFENGQLGTAETLLFVSFVRLNLTDFSVLLPLYTRIQRRMYG